MERLPHAAMECWWERPSEILPSPRGWPGGLADGLMVGVCTLAVTVLLELLSLDAVRDIVRKDARLYRQAVVANLSNNLVLGPLIYCGGVNLFAARERRPSAESLAVGVCMTLGHAVGADAAPRGHDAAQRCVFVGYYAAHRAMHTKRLFWMHAFHHRFNRLVCPVAANAVTCWEYAFAYMAPFFVLIPFFRPDARAVVFAGSSVSLGNLLIHAPPLAAASARLPAFCCSTAAHLAHHREYQTNFGASTLKFDAVLRSCPPLERAVDRAFLRILGK